MGRRRRVRPGMVRVILATMELHPEDAIDPVVSPAP